MAKNGLNPDQVQSLVRKLEKFQKIVDSAADAVVTLDESRQVVYMNRAEEEMFGYARSEVMGHEISAFLPEEYRRPHRQFADRVFRSEGGRLLESSLEVQGKCADGRRFPMLISFSLAETDEGPLLTMIMRDISREKALAEQVAKAQKLAAVGQMVAVVSHEIRTPLTLIGGFARQLAGDEGLNDKSRRKLSIITEEVGRLEAMLGDLRDYSRPYQYLWSELDLVGLIEHVRELMSPKFGARKFELNLPETPAMVRADGDKISQILINLISNAGEAAGEAGRVSLKLHQGDNLSWHLDVSDTGPGIPPEEVAKVFKPFFTTKKLGTGLGLPVARRIAEDHGGCLELVHHQTTGTCFRLSLPALT